MLVASLRDKLVHLLGQEKYVYTKSFQVRLQPDQGPSGQFICGRQRTAVNVLMKNPVISCDNAQ